METKFHAGDHIGSHYKLLDIIGVGNFSEVWQVEHDELPQKTAAIKVPTDKNYVQQLKSESKIQIYLQHENIVDVIDLNIKHGLPYFVMEYINGGNLRALLEKRNKLEMEEAIDIAIQVLRALHYACRKGVIHRGIKPENILLTDPSCRGGVALSNLELNRGYKDSGENTPTKLIFANEDRDKYQRNRIVKISDFGLGKVGEAVTLQLVSSGNSQTEEGKSLLGALAYMSPEQKSPNRKCEVDDRSDIYSLGVVLFEMLTGHLPEGDVLPSDLSPEIPREVDIIFERCTASLEKRARANDILADIQKVVDRKEIVLLRDLTSNLSSSEATTVFIPRRRAKLPDGVTPITRRTDPDTQLPMAVKREKDDAEMVLVPQGEFLMGSEDNEDERPPHKIYLDAYYIDRYPVTNAQYKKFVKEMSYREPKGDHNINGKFKDLRPWKKRDFNAPDQPVVCVSYEDALVYCYWVGARLPTEAEWEKAARGIDGRIYPWGNDFDKNRCNCWESGICKTTPVKMYESGRSPYGCYDMAGNVCEWCADYYDESYYKYSPFENPKGPKFSSSRVMRGGSWYGIDNFVRCTTRIHNEPWYRYYNRGFRCCISAVDTEDF